MGLSSISRPHITFLVLGNVSQMYAVSHKGKPMWKYGDDPHIHLILEKQSIQRICPKKESCKNISI